MFNPDPNETIVLGGKTYSVQPNPVAPTMALELEGGKAVIYRLRGSDGKLFALKVFRQVYRSPDVARDCERIAPFINFTGLAAASRMVIYPSDPAAQRESDLQYAVLMPWLSGQTWSDRLTRKQPLAPHTAVGAARTLLRILARLEQNGLSHTDISSGNVIVEVRGENVLIELVDLEDMWVRGAAPATYATIGTAGYSFPRLAKGQTTACSEGDRYAGAMMAAEMLAMCHKELSTHARGEGLLEQGVPLSEIRVHLGRIAPSFLPLFDRARAARSLSQCPTLSELAESLVQVQFAQASTPFVPSAKPTNSPHKTNTTFNSPASGTLPVGKPFAPPTTNGHSISSTLPPVTTAPITSPPQPNPASAGTKWWLGLLIVVLLISGGIIIPQLSRHRTADGINAAVGEIVRSSDSDKASPNASPTLAQAKTAITSRYKNWAKIYNQTHPTSKEWDHRINDLMSIYSDEYTFVRSPNPNENYADTKAYYEGNVLKGDTVHTIESITVEKVMAGAGEREFNAVVTQTISNYNPYSETKTRRSVSEVDTWVERAGTWLWKRTDKFRQGKLERINESRPVFLSVTAGIAKMSVSLPGDWKSDGAGNHTSPTWGDGGGIYRVWRNSKTNSSLILGYLPDGADFIDTWKQDLKNKEGEGKISVTSGPEDSDILVGGRANGRAEYNERSKDTVTEQDDNGEKRAFPRAHMERVFEVHGDGYWYTLIVPPNYYNRHESVFTAIRNSVHFE